MKKSAAKRQPTTKQIVESVQAWQADGTVHPLTCGVDSAHNLLEPAIERDAVVLKCPDCGYTQTDVPPVVLVHKRSRKTPLMVPPIGLKSTEAVERFRQVEPAPKGQADTADRIWLLPLDSSRWSVRLNSGKGKTFPNWASAVEAAEEKSNQHSATIWINDGHSERPLKAH